MGENICKRYDRQGINLQNKQTTQASQSQKTKQFNQNMGRRDFPGGAVVRNPPASAGDVGSSPGPGRSHIPWSN